MALATPGLPSPYDQVADIVVYCDVSVTAPRAYLDWRSGAKIHAAYTTRELRVGLIDGSTLKLCVPGDAGDDEIVRQIHAHWDARHPTPVPQAEVPRRTGKALGFRSWKLDGYKLLSANQHFGGWKIGEPTKAECRDGGVLTQKMLMAMQTGFLGSPVTDAPRVGHDAPHPGCACGLYALHSPEFASRWHGEDPKMVHGAVLGWGRMQVHWEGWRAEYGQPVMLAIDGERQTYNHCERVKALGAELGLPVVEWPDYEAQARKLAQPVPDELRPEKPAFATGGIIGAGAALVAQWAYGSGWQYHCAVCGVMTGYGPVPSCCPQCGR